MNGDGAANEMQSAARRRELKDQVSEDHGVVVSDAAVVFDREQEREVHALGDRRERARGLRGRDREATVEVGDEHLLEEAVGFFVGGDAVEPQLLGKSALDRAEGALASAASLGGASADMIDAEHVRGHYYAFVWQQPVWLLDVHRGRA